MITENKNSILKLDPRTKMVILIVSMVVAVKCVSLKPALIYALMLGIILFLEGERYSAIVSLSAVMIIIFMYTCVEQGDYSSVLNMICMSLLIMIRFFCPIAMALILFTKTTGMSHLMAAFQKMHLPMVFVIPFVVLIRFMPTIADEWTGIKKAMLFRGIEVNLKSVLFRPVQTMEHTMVPLLFSSVELMDELASSAMVRGLDSTKKRSSYAKAEMRMTDYLLVMIFIGFMVYMLFLY